MNQIKVEITQKFPTDKATIGGIVGWAQVAQVKLVLVDTDPKEALLFKSSNGNIFVRVGEGLLVKTMGTYLKPILISETEKIEGDWYYDDRIHELRNAINGIDKTGHEFKVLALSEHFSPQQLQDIVNGKLKDGDKLLIECEQYWDKQTEPQHQQTFRVKLDSSNHITLHKVEEKMYTREEMEKTFLAAFEMGKDWRTYTAREYPHLMKNWFEQNVK